VARRADRQRARPLPGRLAVGRDRRHRRPLFVGFHLTFLVQHWLGTKGMPRRYADHLRSDGFTALNTISTIGSFLLGASMLPFLWNV